MSGRLLKGARVVLLMAHGALAKADAPPSDVFMGLADIGGIPPELGVATPKF